MNDRIRDLILRLAELGADFDATAHDLGRCADELAVVEAELMAASVAAGRPPLRPAARELAAEVALGRLAALRPHLPFTTRAAADRAAEQLSTPAAEGEP